MKTNIFIHQRARSFVSNQLHFNDVLQRGNTNILNNCLIHCFSIQSLWYSIIV